MRASARDGSYSFNAFGMAWPGFKPLLLACIRGAYYNILPIKSSGGAYRGRSA